MTNIDLLINRLATCKHVNKYHHAAGSHNLFNMSREQFNCGAPQCMLGHAADLANGECGLAPGIGHLIEFADWLGIEHDLALELYDPSSGHHAGDITNASITPQQAIVALQTIKSGQATAQNLWSHIPIRERDEE